MAKFSKTNQHDYMRFKATFKDGQAISGNYSRGGHTVGLEPYEPELARAVSNVFTNVDRATKQGVFNLGQFFEVLEPVAVSSDTPEKFLVALGVAVKDRFAVDVASPIERPLRDATTVSTGKKGRSVTIDVKFENGEDFQLSLAGRSVSFNMQPAHSLFMSKISSMSLGMASMSTPAEVVERFKEAAEGASDIEGWIENIQSGYRPAAPAVASMKM